jgi:hypothetical protein
VTAPDELETTLLEWAKGPYQLSTDECIAVMARLAELEAENRTLREALNDRPVVELERVDQVDSSSMAYTMTQKEYAARIIHAGRRFEFKVLGDIDFNFDESAWWPKVFDDLKAELTLARNQLGNAVGAIIDSGTHSCEGPHDVSDAIYRLTAERDAYKALTVEAAALAPIVGLEDQYYECYWCEGEGDYFIDRATHRPDCLWLRLKAAADPLHTHNTPETTDGPV